MLAEKMDIPPMDITKRIILYSLDITLIKKNIKEFVNCTDFLPSLVLYTLSLYVCIYSDCKKKEKSANSCKKCEVMTTTSNVIGARLS